jgi:hypothetical protein
MSELVLHLKGYRFYAVHEEDFSLFILSVGPQHCTYGPRLALRRLAVAPCRHVCSRGSLLPVFLSVHVCATRLVVASYTENVSVPALATHNKEILEAILRLNGLLIAD